MIAVRHRSVLPSLLLVVGALIGACDTGTEPADAPDRWVHVATGLSHVCGLKSSGAAFCWGSNFQGQIGDATLEDRLVPTAVRDVPPLRSVEVAGDRACGLDDRGAAWCWGDNDQGQIGDGRLGLPAVVGSPVAGGHRFQSLSLGPYLACGLDLDGEAWCWGGDRFRSLLPTDSGELCPGAYAQLAWSCFDRPVRPQPGTRFRDITVGLFHFCAVDLGGNATCWGSSRYGELGIGDAAPDRCVNQSAQSEFDIPCAVTPTPVTGGLTFTELSAGAIITCGITGTGSAYCWGADRFNNGQLGTGTLQGSWMPERVQTTRAVAQLTPSTENSVRATTCAVASDGTGLCWGANDLGQTGSAAAESCYRGLLCATRPTEVSGGLRFIEIDPSAAVTCGVTADGGLYCWGANDVGQLGDGTRDNRAAPGPVVEPVVSGGA